LFQLGRVLARENRGPVDGEQLPGTLGVESAKTVLELTADEGPERVWNDTVEFATITGHESALERAERVEKGDLRGELVLGQIEAGGETAREDGWRDGADLGGDL
jgi:hypothetical protein